MPSWLAGLGGWTNATAALPAFKTFADAVIDALLPCGNAVEWDSSGFVSTCTYCSDVDLHSIVPFNEPHVFNLLT